MVVQQHGLLRAGLVIERVSGQSYYDYVRDHVLKPAGMINTDNYNVDEDVPSLALGYTTRERMGARIQAAGAARTPSCSRRGSPAGDGYSTVEDLLGCVRRVA